MFRFGDITVELGRCSGGEQGGVQAWSLANLRGGDSPIDVDGILTHSRHTPKPAANTATHDGTAAHPNGCAMC